MRHYSPTLPTMKPSTKPLSSALTSILLKPSTIIMNKYEARGSSCLKPLDASTQPLVAKHA